MTVVDLDATIVFASSFYYYSFSTYKSVIFFFPNLSTFDYTYSVLVIDPLPFYSSSFDSQDYIAALDTAVSLLPEAFLRLLLVRLDGAGYSYELLEHIAAGIF